MGYAGPHAETKPQAIARWRDFIAGHLTGTKANRPGGSHGPFEIKGL